MNRSSLFIRPLVLSLCLCMSGVSLGAQPPEQDENRPPRRRPLAGPRGEGRPREQGDGFRGQPGQRFRDRREGRPMGEGRPELTPEMIERAMQMVKERFPVMHERLSRLQQNNPQRFEEAMHRLMFIHHEYRALRERNAEQAERMMEGLRAEEKLYTLSDQYQAAANDPAQQTAIEQQIGEVVRQQTMIMQQRREARLAEFAQRLERQQLRLEEERRRFETEKGSIEEMIARRVESIKQGLIRPGLLEGGPPHGKGGPGGPHDGRRPRGPRPDGGFGPPPEGGPDEFGGPMPHDDDGPPPHEDE